MYPIYFFLCNITKNVNILCEYHISSARPSRRAHARPPRLAGARWAAARLRIIHQRSETLALFRVWGKFNAYYVKRNINLSREWHFIRGFKGKCACLVILFAYGV